MNTIFIVLGANAAIELATVAGPVDRADLLFYLKWADFIESTFLAFYTFELLLRLYAHRCSFFCCEEAGWNILDFVLVVTSIGALVIALVVGSGKESTSGMMAMRATRLIKLAKLLRVVRAFRFFKQLHLFIACVLGCVENLFWAVVMVLLVLLLFAIHFVQAFESWISVNSGADASEEVQSAIAMILEQFGSVQMGILTLSKAVSGGDDWTNVYDTVSKTGYTNSAVFLIMIIFFAVAVWNIIASIFLENTIKSATVDREEEVLTRRRADMEDAKELMALCRNADVDNSGTISEIEFAKFMACPLIREFFLIRGLDIKNAAHFFHVINEVTEGNEVDLEEFVGSCLRVKGNATSIDLHMLAFEARTMHSKTKRFMEFASASLTELADRTDRTLAVMRSQTSKVAALGVQWQDLLARQPALAGRDVNLEETLVPEGKDTQSSL
eukprot:TRINITY_DN11824_c0_g1_i2.p1 TRINITY_DN11824_c0_g1~~TRINITY_DN11824_c0_g1_i2.p1  ORF type:complete len:443 (-),score=70.48 TRINITY_DN11824_c0_g1_i2:155-1483(-)